MSIKELLEYYKLYNSDDTRDYMKLITWECLDVCCNCESVPEIVIEPETIIVKCPYCRNKIEGNDLLECCINWNIKQRKL